MPDAIITSTASTFGTISGTFAADQSTIAGTVTGIVVGTLSGSVGVPGPQGPTGATGATGATGPTGPAGSPGVGVPVGGTAGQFLTKIDGTNYNTDWTTVNLSVYAVKANNLSDLASASTARTNLGLGSLAVVNDAPSDGSQYARKNGAWDVVSASAFITSVSLPLAVTTGNLTIDLSAYLTSATAASTYQTLAGMSSYLTTATAASTYYLQTNPSGFQTAANVTTALSPYLLSATAATTYAVIAAGQPTSGTVGQVLTKNSGTNYDSSWATLIPGDRYLTTSTTSNTVSNGNKTFTIGTGLSYTPTQSITISYDASNHMHGEVLTYNSGTGVLTVDINHHTGSGTYAAWVVNVGGVVPATSVAWGGITGTLSAQTDLQSALDLKANLASPALTGNVTITTNSAGAALFIEQAGAGNILTLHDQATDTNFVAIDANGKVNTIPSEATNGAGLNVPHGAAPTTPVNGDIWSTTTALFARINASTKQMMTLSDTQTVSGSITFSNATQTLGNSTATSTINVGTGATLTATTKTVNVGTGGVSGSTTNTTIGPVLGASTTSIGGTTAASTLNLATGATLTATTKAVNIGTAGVAGSTTNIAIGSTTGTSTTTLQGNVTASGTNLDLGNSTAASTVSIGSGATTTGLSKVVNIATGGATGSTTTLNLGSAQSPSGILNIKIGETTGTTTTNVYGSFILNSGGTSVTAAVDNNSTAIATTAFVVGQAGSATPLVNGTAAVGTSLRYARQDHVHGTDTTRAALASPTFTGTPLSTTAAADTNTTQIATTAFVVGQASSTAPAATGTAAVGTSLKYARADHVHVNPLPVGGTASQVLSKVDGTNYNVAWTTVASGGGVWGSITGTLSSQTDLQGALDAKLSTATAATTYAPLASPALTGTPTAPTAATSTNTTQVATTAYVVGQAGTATPVVNGTAAVGTSLLYSRQDHVHPTDTTRAPLASPSLTGTPLSTTAAVDTNTTQIATTAFVVAQAASATPLVNGTAAVGTSLRYARADHVHGTDTTRAPLASPSFSGTPSLPTGTIAVTQTAGNNTTAVATTAFVRADNNVKAWVNFNGTGTVAIRASYNVSSITDNGVGDYTVNFTTAMADSSYSVNGVIGDGIVNNDATYALKLRTPNTAQIAGSVRVGTNFAAPGPAFGSADFSHIGMTITR